MDTLSTSGLISSFFSASFDPNVANSHPQQDAEVAERTVNPNIIRTQPVVNQYNLMTGLPPLPPESSTSASHSLPSLVNPNRTPLQTRYPADPFDRSHSSLTRIKALYLDSMSLIPFSGLLLTLAGDPQPPLGQGSLLFRPKPYSKPLSPPAGRKVSDSSRWSHDLFEDDSNLYGPKVRYQVNPSPDLISFGSPRPLPLLRPFGSTAIPPSTASPLSTFLPAPSTKTNSLPTPAAQPVVSRERPAMKHLPQPLVVSSNSGISLLSLIQSSDTQKPLMASDSTLLRPSSSSGHPQPWKPLDASQITRPTPSPAAAHPEKKTHPAQNAKNQQALFDEAMAKYLNGPVILEVANLANGTSAEDVKTAFADFGEIQECSTKEGLRQANQPTLKARMIFTHKAQAEKAVDALNGALADGLTLAVKIVGRPTKKPERADFMTTSQGDAKPAKPSSDTAMKSADDDITMDDGESPVIPTGPVVPNMLSRVQPLAAHPASSLFPTPSAYHHCQHHHHQSLFSAPRASSGAQIHPAASYPHFHHLPTCPQEYQRTSSLLARIKSI
ncbi:hypothetical protein PCANC_23914 [Puccinia coronata f. sp. avenae]|uniref:RRM domain-containing protein n=1 Tax=Puccinia coronata f. sp. avenae TaxID=200324 RepID=A0A2N5U7H4_9BASI|nr:hypothetical protein PCANC_23914 [Puccinia coronata f. sp. avenae]